MRHKIVRMDKLRNKRPLWQKWSNSNAFTGKPLGTFHKPYYHTFSGLTKIIQPLMKIKGECRERGRLTGKFTNRLQDKAPWCARTECAISSLCSSNRLKRIAQNFSLKLKLGRICKQLLTPPECRTFKKFPKARLKQRGWRDAAAPAFNGDQRLRQSSQPFFVMSRKTVHFAASAGRSCLYPQVILLSSRPPRAASERHSLS